MNYIPNLWVVCYERHESSCTTAGFDPIPQDLVEFVSGTKYLAVLLRAPTFNQAMLLVDQVDGHCGVNYYALRAIPVTKEMIEAPNFDDFLTGRAHMFQENPPDLKRIRLHLNG